MVIIYLEVSNVEKCRGLSWELSCLISLSMEEVMEEHTLIRSADGTKLEEAAGMGEGSAAIQRHLDRLEEWANRKIIKFRKVRCTSLYLGRKSPLQQIEAVA